MATEKEVVALYGLDELRFQKIEFADKIILNVLVNDVIDTTFDIPLSTHAAISLTRDEDALGIEPVVLVGDPHNLKLQVVAAQIGKIVQLTEPRNVILSIGSRWFGRGDKTEQDDFEKLMFVGKHVKEVLQL